MFMRLVFTTAILCAAIASPSVAIAAPVPAAPSGVCSKLSADYDQAEKALAMTFAEGIGDDSAVRETNRQVESSNYITSAAIAVNLMEEHHCASLPDHAPSIARYMSNALSCKTDRLKSGDSSDVPSCKMDTWK